MGRALIEVPATSANLGPGFDIIGMSIDNLVDVLEVSWDEDADEMRPVKVIPGGLYEELGCSVPEDESNMVYQLISDELADLCQEYVDEYKPRDDVYPEDCEYGLSDDIKHAFENMKFSIICHNNIPHARGLGSSSAAIVSALRAAFRIGRAALFNAGLYFDDDPVEIENDTAFLRGVSIEGHPDNIAPCVYGGIQLSQRTKFGGYNTTELKPKSGLHVELQILGGDGLKTESAREVLPKQMSYSDAVESTRSFGLLVLGLTQGDDKLLLDAKDFLHQEYRRPLYSKSMELVDLGLENGIPTFISGAGTSVISMWFRPESGVDELLHTYDRVFKNSKPSREYSNIRIAPASSWGA